MHLEGEARTAACSLLPPRKRLQVVLRPARRAKHPEHLTIPHVEEEEKCRLRDDRAHDGGLRGRKAEEATAEAFLLCSRVAQEDDARRRRHLRHHASRRDSEGVLLLKVLLLLPLLVAHEMLLLLYRRLWAEAIRWRVL